MKFLHSLFPAAQLVISVLFIVSAAALMVIAVLQLWEGIHPMREFSTPERLNAVLEAIAVLTVAVAALQLAQTVLEEEVQRGAHMSSPTRVRRFLSRFMVVLVVALSIETLVLAFRFSQEAPEYLPYVSAVGLTAAAMMAAWGVFVRLNRSAEELEPEAMQRVKREDHEVEKEKSVKGEPI